MARPFASDYPGGLTAFQRRFVAEYLIDLNAAAAYRRAGGATKHAANRGSELKAYPAVAAAIAKAEGERAAKVGVTAERIVAELAKVGFANMADYMRVGPDGDPVLDFSALTRDHTAALAEVTVDDYVDGRGKAARDVKRVKFKLADKIAALEKLGRHLQMFIERREITGENGGPIVIVTGVKRASDK